jgi:hypothetical protein
VNKGRLRRTDKNPQTIAVTLRLYALRRGLITCLETIATPSVPQFTLRSSGDTIIAPLRLKNSISAQKRDMELKLAPKFKLLNDIFLKILVEGLLTNLIFTRYRYSTIMYSKMADVRFR